MILVEYSVGELVKRNDEIREVWKRHFESIMFEIGRESRSDQHWIKCKAALFVNGVGEG